MRLVPHNGTYTVFGDAEIALGLVWRHHSGRWRAERANRTAVPGDWSTKEGAGYALEADDIARFGA